MSLNKKTILNYANYVFSQLNLQIQNHAMKIKLLPLNTTSALLMLLFTFTFSNAMADRPEVKGYYVNRKGDTIHTVFRLARPWGKKMRREFDELSGIEVITPEGKKRVITPRNADGYGYEFEGEKFIYQFVRYPAAMWDKYGFFYRLHEDGPCKLYSYILTSSPMAAHESFERYYLYFKSTDLVFCPNSTVVNQGKTIENFFSNCPQVLSKLNTPGFEDSPEGYFNVVRYYNVKCADQ
jgi:hypothetical protein